VREAIADYWLEKSAAQGNVEAQNIFDPFLAIKF
jgi:TPR repeat protein